MKKNEKQYLIMGNPRQCGKNHFYELFKLYYKNGNQEKFDNLKELWYKQYVGLNNAKKVKIIPRWKILLNKIRNILKCLLN